jgi:hypothetical protein
MRLVVAVLGLCRIDILLAVRYLPLPLGVILSSLNNVEGCLLLR